MHLGYSFPEVTLEILCDWNATPGPSASAPGAQDRKTQVCGHQAYDAALGVWLDEFIDRWLQPGERDDCRTDMDR